jgi:acyl-CoA thioesterase
MLPFQAASAVERIGEHHYRTQIPDGWQQGRGAFGGLVLGILLRAMEADDPERRRVVRSLAGDVCGPVLPGPAELKVRVLRRGNNQSNLFVELTQGNADVLAAATAVFSPPRTAHHHAGVFAPPPPSSWREITPLPVRAPLGPSFAQHYEYRDAGSTPSSVEGWIREAQPPAQLDAAALVGRLDAWFPTLFHLEGAPRPCATVSFTAEFLADPASLPGEEPLRYRARLAGMNDGFFVELRELWQGDRPVALNQQTFAILK